MKKATFIVILVALTVASLTICEVSAQTITLLGVKPGDNFTYSFEVFWTSTDPNEVVPELFSEMNRTISINVNVTDVSTTTTAYVNVTHRMRDGNSDFTPGFIDVSSGRGVEAQLLIIGANLTAGDKAYPDSVGPPSAAESFTLGETVTKTYLGTSKTANHYTERVTNSTTGNYVDRNAYYDKETGVLLEMTITHYYSDLGETDSEHWRITQFNSATAPPSDGTSDGTNGTDSGLSAWLIPTVILVVAASVIVLAAVLLIRRRKKAQVTTAVIQDPSHPLL